jgi:hypothetical protein
MWELHTEVWRNRTISPRFIQAWLYLQVPNIMYRDPGHKVNFHMNTTVHLKPYLAIHFFLVTH